MRPVANPKIKISSYKTFRKRPVLAKIADLLCLKHQIRLLHINNAFFQPSKPFLVFSN